MANLQVITQERHLLKRWQRHQNYHVAATDAVCPLVSQELPKVLVAMPIGFIFDGEQFLPVVVQGLKPGKNLFVAPDGRWLTSYVPAAYRGYPFRMATTAQGEEALCVDEDSGLVSDMEGEPFFDEDGKVSASLISIFEFFNNIEADRSVTRVRCAALEKYNLIQPWDINLREEGGEIKVEGLFRVDEPALNALPGEALVELRDIGALSMAYCQLLSMQHLPTLGTLAHAHAEAEKKQQEQTSMLKSDTFNFGGLF